MLYSAPFTLIGQTLWVRATDVSVSIFQDYRLVATHVRSHRHGDRRTVLDHLPPDAREFFAHDRQWCVQQARAIGPACAELIEQLLSDRIVERLRGAQGILGFASTYGAARVEAGERHFDIRLDPPDLGRIEVQLSVDSSGRADSSSSLGAGANRPKFLK